MKNRHRRRLGPLLLMLPLLLLTGCRAAALLPAAQEPRGQALPSLLAYGAGQEGDCLLYAAAAGQEGKEPVSFSSSGHTLAEARSRARIVGERPLSFAHVEELLLEDQLAGPRLEELLSYAFQNGEQSAEAEVYLLREATLGEVFVAGQDPAARLGVLSGAGEGAAALPAFPLRQLAAQVADGGCVLLPALRLELGVLQPAGYAIWKEGSILGYLEGDAALGAAMLAGGRPAWVESIRRGDGSFLSWEIETRGGTVKALWQAGELKGLQVHLRLRATQQEGEKPSAAEWEQLRYALWWKAEAGAAVLQAHKADAVGLERRAGLQTPWRWAQVQEDWEEIFPRLPLHMDLNLLGQEP